MKSPNAKMSMKLLQTAIDALENARHDLKNDPEVRSLGAHALIEDVERKIKGIIQALKTIGYP